MTYNVLFFSEILLNFPAVKILQFSSLAGRSRSVKLPLKRMQGELWMDDHNQFCDRQKESSTVFLSFSEDMQCLKIIFLHPFSTKKKMEEL